MKLLAIPALLALGLVAWIVGEAVEAKVRNCLAR